MLLWGPRVVAFTIDIRVDGIENGAINTRFTRAIPAARRVGVQCSIKRPPHIIDIIIHVRYLNRAKYLW